MNRLLLGVSLWAVGICLPAVGWALHGNPQKDPIAVDGSVRTLGGWFDYYDFPLLYGSEDDQAVSQSLLRLIVGGKPANYFAYEIHGVQSFDATTADRNASVGIGATTFGVSGAPARYQALDTNFVWHDAEHTSAVLFFDRWNARVSAGGFDLTAGRQAITLGKAYFWSPLDVFSPFGSGQFDRDYKTGVDALRLDHAFNSFSGMNLFGVAGRTNPEANTADGYEVTWFGSAILARVFTTYEGFDLSLQGGKIYGGTQVGGGTVGDVGPVQLRVEGTHFFAEEPITTRSLASDAFSLVTGVGRRFENTLDLQLEYFFNGGGDSDQMDLSFLRRGRGEILQMTEHVLGLYSTYEFTPIIVGRMGLLFAPLPSPSVEIQPGIVFSLTDEAELLIGAIVHAGERPNGRSPTGLGIQSEFGSLADLYYGEFKYYF